MCRRSGKDAGPDTAITGKPIEYVLWTPSAFKQDKKCIDTDVIMGSDPQPFMVGHFDHQSPKFQADVRTSYTMIYSPERHTPADRKQ